MIMGGSGEACEGPLIIFFRVMGGEGMWSGVDDGALGVARSGGGGLALCLSLGVAKRTRSSA